MRQSVFGPIRQLAYLVDDIEQAIANWHRQTGIGPFALVRDCQPLAGSRYRGEETGDVRVNLAFAYLGEIQLELIEQLNETPSLYREALDRGAMGLHHYGVCVGDYDEAYEFALNNGFSAAVEAGAKGFARMAYLESGEIDGLVFEVIEWNEFTRPYFDGIRQFLDSADDSQLIHDYNL
jgi:hypothetical protein